MKKRNERNFSKKIKVHNSHLSYTFVYHFLTLNFNFLQYACRKTLADSRPRVRGRFAKNDEFGEHHRSTCNTHEEDTDEDVKTVQVRN